MSQHEQSGAPPTRTAGELRDWLLQEIKDSSKACELRIKEAVSVVTSFALGELSATQAEEGLWKYEQRWGEALPGTYASENITDEEIVASIDAAKGPYASLHSIRTKLRKPGPSR